MEWGNCSIQCMINGFSWDRYRIEILVCNCFFARILKTRPGFQIFLSRSNHNMEDSTSGPWVHLKLSRWFHVQLVLLDSRSKVLKSFLHRIPLIYIDENCCSAILAKFSWTISNFFDSLVKQLRFYKHSMRFQLR